MLYKFSKLLPSLLCISLLMVSGIASADRNVQNPAITLSQNPSQSPKKLIPAQVVHAVRQDLAKRTKIAAGKFKVKESSPQTWHDGCLGLAKPNEFCTMALVEGWQVVMVNGNKTWMYRTDNSGRAVRLEKF
jgi:outer membrane lipoprotein-sorting protein